MKLIIVLNAIQFYEHCNKTIDFEKARRVYKNAELDKIIEDLQAAKRKNLKNATGISSSSYVSNVEL